MQSATIHWKNFMRGRNNSTSAQSITQQFLDYRVYDKKQYTAQCTNTTVHSETETCSPFKKQQQQRSKQVTLLEHLKEEQCCFIITQEKTAKME